ncbi:MAG: aminoacyl-tRNA hydrolase [Bacteroidetes bacterium]|jgi:PTH1 family peptidyl-tRNA hydrolase|nr:aminoacyl-tRNA hydrolase [Bacteroidota bacterium]
MGIFLLVGLGNPGEAYRNTRHNIGFDVVDAIATKLNLEWKTDRFGLLARGKYKSRSLLLLKPNTYMNKSGDAVRHWVNAEHIDPEDLLVVTDDLALPLGQLRLRPKGGAGGHNGLSDIERALGHQQYARMRFGIDRKFKSGQQSDYVLGAWEAEDLSTVAFSKERAAEGALLWVFQGLSRAMNTVNVNPPNPEI